MKLEKWALAAEVFSAFAVFATLIVLLLEVRAGNELTRIASFQDILVEFNDLRSLAIENPDLANLMVNASSGAYPPWGSPEASQLRLMLTNDFNTTNIAYFSFKAGILSEPEWARLARTACDQSASLPADYKESIYFRLTDDFAAFLDSEC